MFALLPGGTGSYIQGWNDWVVSAPVARTDRRSLEFVLTDGVAKHEGGQYDHKVDN